MFERNGWIQYLSSICLFFLRLLINSRSGMRLERSIFRNELKHHPTVSTASCRVSCVALFVTMSCFFPMLIVDVHDATSSYRKTIRRRVVVRRDVVSCLCVGSLRSTNRRGAARTTTPTVYLAFVFYIWCFP